MSDNRIKPETTEPSDADHPVGTVRLLPVVTFGVRAAALAGLMLPVGMAATGVDTLPGDSPVTTEGVAVPVFTAFYTTCCPPSDV